MASRVASWMGLAWPWISTRSSLRAGSGRKVVAGGEEGAHKALGVVVAAKVFGGELHESGFGAVGNELDGVDEVFSSSAQLGESLLGRKVFDLDVFRGGFALSFEGFELGLE